MFKLTEMVAASTVPSGASLDMSVHYTFIEAGKEVSHVFNFSAKNQEQYEQFNRALHSGLPETF
jgi:hypothetical protein